MDRVLSQGRPSILAFRQVGSVEQPKIVSLSRRY